MSQDVYFSSFPQQPPNNQVLGGGRRVSGSCPQGAAKGSGRSSPTPDGTVLCHRSGACEHVSCRPVGKLGG